jgi:hypothetical protein
LPKVISEKTLSHCVSGAAGVSIRSISEPLCANTFGDQYKSNLLDATSISESKAVEKCSV